MPNITPSDVPITAGSGTNVAVDQLKDSAGATTNVQYMKVLDAAAGSGSGMTVNPDGSINVAELGALLRTLIYMEYRTQQLIAAQSGQFLVADPSLPFIGAGV